MMKKALAVLLAVFPAFTWAALDPLGCANGGAGLSDSELNALGYEVVQATPNDGNDDTVSIQNTINTAMERRRIVFFRPGTYNIRNPLTFRSDRQGTKNQGGTTQYGGGMLGSFCGTEKPTLVYQDGRDNRTNFSEVGKNPTPMAVFWRAPDVYVASRIDDWRDNQGGRNYNVTVRNMKFVTGANRGVVAIWMNSAEGSYIHDTEIDATGGFAGTYSVPSSGGHIYNLKVTGGQYGIYTAFNRGGSPPYVGVTLYDQVIAPIGYNHYAPLVFVGADIRFNGGQVAQAINRGISKWPTTNRYYVSSVSVRPVCGASTKAHQNGWWGLAFVDSKIELTGSGNPDMFPTGGCMIHLRNVYVKGTTEIVNPNWGTGKLKVSNKNQWFRIPEYSVGRAHNARNTQKIESVLRNHNHHSFNAEFRAISSSFTSSEQSDPPGAMISQHFYKTASCNPERLGMVDAYDHGARTSLNNNAPNINAAINAAGDDGMVWIRGGTANVSTGVVPLYKIKGTINLKKNTELCGVTRHATRLSAIDWLPGDNEANQPILRTQNNADAAPLLRDFMMLIPPIRGAYQGASIDTTREAFKPHVYGIDWRSGKTAWVNVWVMRGVFGPNGDRNQIWIRNEGGGQLFGMQGTDTYRPENSQNTRFTRFAHNPKCQCYRDTQGELTLSPNGRLLRIINTTNPMTVYGLHCQYAQHPTAALCSFDNTENVSVYGSKAETITQGDGTVIPGIHANNPPTDIPALAFVTDSKNFVWIGAEGISEVGANRGVVEVYNSTDVTIVGHVVGRDSDIENDNGRFLVEMDDDNNGIQFGSGVALFRDSTTAVPVPPETEGGPGLRPVTPSDFTLKVAKHP